MHWPQEPDFSAAGADVSLSEALLADDFRCSATGPVRDIHIWGSFLNDVLPHEGPAGLTLELSIYSDVPGNGKAWSRPGELLWSQRFTPGQYAARAVHDGAENWYDPVTGEYQADDHRRAYEYSFRAAEPFVQQEGTVYWLGVSLRAADADSHLGWKTTGRRWRWNDRAVCLARDGADWLPLAYPAEHPYAGQALGLAFVITSGDETTGEHELGDAPDSSNGFAAAELPAYPGGIAGDFPTVYQAGSPPYGPLHLMPRDAFYLGRWVSLENEADLGPDEDGVTNVGPSAGASNRDGGDDGLLLPVVMPSGQQTTLDYVLTVTSEPVGQVYVNVWCDWNRDGDWNDIIEIPNGKGVPEWAVQDHQPLLSGIGTFTITTPALACWHPDAAVQPDPLWVRITVSERPWAGDPAVGGSGPAGGYRYGETEDYYLRPWTEPGAAAYDWGDAPDNAETPGYPTLAAHDGARHVVGGPWLGKGRDRPDAEADGQPHAAALGDDTDDNSDENGVSIPPLVQGAPASITLEVGGGGGVVQGWIDFNGDQSWQDSEQVVDDFLPNGIHVVSFHVPQDAALGRTFARFRVNRSGGLDPRGEATDGEVEDHEVWVRPVPMDAKWCQWPDPTSRGIDIRVDGSSAEPRALADDFPCTSADRLTMIRLWGSWKSDERGQLKRIRVTIHPDDPVGPDGADGANRFSQPGPETLWEKVFFPGEFQETLYHIGRIAGPWWWDAASGELVSDSDSKIWQIDLKVDRGEAFIQSGSPAEPQIYWLAVEAEAAGGQFGWKTRHWPDHSMGDAVLNPGSRVPHAWQELRYPEGHPCYDLQMNSVDLAFCLMYTPDEPDQPTSRPGSVTQCPAVETQCPATATQCPTMTTLCPAVETKCPAVVTQCPPVATQCPPSQTACPSTATQCPAVETRCPATATECPATTTLCPPVETACPAGVTQCPVVLTQCPSSQTACPSTATKCPTVATQCPATATQCPSATTQCPALATTCPVGVTQCPTVQTQCPATATECPSAATECPMATTRCPATATACPPVQTQCPVVATECPMDLTKCPDTCRPPEFASAQNVTAALPGQVCPPVEAACPTVADYLALAAIR